VEMRLLRVGLGVASRLTHQTLVQMKSPAGAGRGECPHGNVTPTPRAAERFRLGGGTLGEALLEGIVAKRKRDPQRRGMHWWKIKNPAYSQAEGRHELFNGGERAKIAAVTSVRVARRKPGPELTEG
jgi:hypothetical protein